MMTTDVFNPPNGGDREQWVLRERNAHNTDNEGDGPVFTINRGEKQYWKCLGPDLGVGLTANAGDASTFRLHLVSRSCHQPNDKIQLGESILHREDKKVR